MGWVIGIIVFIIIAVVGFSIAFKKDNARRSADYDNLSEEDKKKITREEYIKRREARETNHSTNTNVLEDLETPQIIDCPACGEKVSNKAKSCPIVVSQ